jgi:putative photosynthetic complex assembly protein 2
VLTGLGIVLLVTAAWWCATGVILHLGGRPRSTFRHSMMIASLLLAFAAVALHLSSASRTIAGACVAFMATVLIWGWLEMSFLLGAITGPRRRGCAPGCHGWAHLRHAVEAILYHELLTIAGAVLVAALCWGAGNQTGIWTYLILWGMRISAKLNLFLGVPNTAISMLPPHMEYLGTFFSRRAAGPMFTASVIGATLLCAGLIGAAYRVSGWNFLSAERTLLATLAVLALIEHWMLVLPMPAHAPWGAWRPGRALPIEPRS